MSSGLIRPRQVSPEAWRNWIRQGFALVCRKWPVWIALMTGCCLLTGMAGTVEPVGEYLTLALGFNLAIAVDYESGWAGMAARFGALFRGALRFGCQAGLFVFLATLPLHTAMAPGGVTADRPALADTVLPAAAEPVPGGAGATAPRPLDRSYRETARNLMAWAMLLPAGLGFLYPLRRLGMSFPAALLYGGQAAVLNRGAVLRVAVLAFAGVVLLQTFDLHPLIPVAHGFWIAVGYAMFREIFLGVSENRPVRVGAAVRRTGFLGVPAA